MFLLLPNRKRELKAILSLPDDNLVVRELSGGQQKMVSLCLTFLHQPKLLILDEPTVGSDPVLGNCIWDYLHRLATTDRIGIIIVTHYIEEATFGHVVGIMRDGAILEEGSPSKLVTMYEKKTLEDVFLHLCQVESDNFVRPICQESEDKTDTNNNNLQLEYNDASSELEKKRSERHGSLLLYLWILLVMVKKNLDRFLQFNISFLIFLIPAFQALLLCTIYNRDAVPVSILSLLLDMHHKECSPFTRYALQYSTKNQNHITATCYWIPSRKWMFTI